jgi:hypothetical protein
MVSLMVPNDAYIRYRPGRERIMAAFIGTPHCQEALLSWFPSWLTGQNQICMHLSISGQVSCHKHAGQRPETALTKAIAHLEMQSGPGFASTRPDNQPVGKVRQPDDARKTA